MGDANYHLSMIPPNPPEGGQGEEEGLLWFDFLQSYAIRQARAMQ